MEKFLYAKPKAKKIFDIYHYALQLDGWIDIEIIIPNKITVTAYYAKHFDEYGNVSDGEGGPLNEYTYTSGYQDNNNLPYFRNGNIDYDIDYYGQKPDKEKQAQIGEWLNSRERLITAVGSRYSLISFYNETVDLLTKRYC
jgi:hypothetical protein